MVLTRVAAAVVITSTFAVGHAVTLIGNMPQTNDDGISANLTGLRRKAMGFTVDSQAYELLHVETRFFASTSGTTPILRLYDSIAGGPVGQMPGSMIAQASTQLTIQAGIQTLVFNFSQEIVTPNNTYWLVMGSDGDSYDWRGSSPAITPTGFATHAGALFTADGGATWTNSATLNSYRLEARVIPEPTCGLAVGIGLLLCSRLRRRSG